MPASLAPQPSMQLKHSYGSPKSLHKISCAPSQDPRACLGLFRQAQSALSLSHSSKYFTSSLKESHGERRSEGGVSLLHSVGSELALAVLFPYVGQDTL